MRLGGLRVKKYEFQQELCCKGKGKTVATRQHYFNLTSDRFKNTNKQTARKSQSLKNCELVFVFVHSGLNTISNSINHLISLFF